MSLVPRGRRVWGAIAASLAFLAVLDGVAYAQKRVTRARPETFQVPQPLRGSPEKLIRQNEGATADGLPVIQSVVHLEELATSKVLEPIRTTAGLIIDVRLPEHRRLVAPWVNDFLEDLASEFSREFPTARPLQLNSAARDLPFQRFLTRRTRRGVQRNPNAAPTSGEKTSAHLRGAAVDITHLNRSVAEKRWIAGHLEVLQSGGLIDATVEQNQAVFHVTVFKRYRDERLLGVAQLDAPSTGQLDLNAAPFHCEARQ